MACESQRTALATRQTEHSTVTKRTQSAVDDTASAIERYLFSRPEAVETVDGIARWWLHRQRLEDSLELVQSALDELVHRGVVERLTMAGGTAMYRTAPGRPVA